MRLGVAKRFSKECHQSKGVGLRTGNYGSIRKINVPKVSRIG